MLRIQRLDQIDSSWSCFRSRTQEVDEVKESRQKGSEEGSFQKFTAWKLAVLLLGSSKYLCSWIMSFYTSLHPALCILRYPFLSLCQIENRLYPSQLQDTWNPREGRWHCTVGRVPKCLVPSILWTPPGESESQLGNREEMLILGRRGNSWQATTTSRIWIGEVSFTRKLKLISDL